MSKQSPQSTPGDSKPLPAGDEKANHSVKDEEQLGWDQAPTGADTPDPHRHPRQLGEGGTPDAGEDAEKDTPMGDTSSKHLREKDEG